MRLPTPLEDDQRESKPPIAMLFGIGALVVVGAIAWLTIGGSDTDSPADGDVAPTGSTPIDAGVSSAASMLVPLATPARVLDTRVGETTVDGRYAGAGVILPGAPLVVQIAGRLDRADETRLIALTVTATAGPEAVDLIVEACGAEAPGAPSIRIGSMAAATRDLVVALGTDEAICFVSSAPVDVIADVTGFLDADDVRPLPGPIRIVDTREGAGTADGEFAAIGLRPEHSTLEIPVSARFEEFTNPGALVVNVSVVQAHEPGEASVFAGDQMPSSPTFEYQARTTGHSGATVVALGGGGEMCVSTTGRTHVIVDVLAVVPASASPPIASVDGCPEQTVFPTHRIVALYGTERSARLGVLGEQDASASAARVAAVAEPWRAGDRSVLPAFELIATMATMTPEDRGVYNIRSSPEFVQQYLDVARRHGYLLILDVQPGQSDFLTEVKYYEEFLRYPDVALALDPEWRVEPPDRPIGGSVGQVDATEVNAVIEYVAQLVEEEGLPEKLVVVHQFQDRMITNREQLVELPGVALTIHMDGFGDRANKLESWDVIRVPPPLNMGLKLFYDEDIGMVSADEVLAGLFEPIPDLITYQ